MIIPIRHASLYFFEPEKLASAAAFLPKSFLKSTIKATKGMTARMMILRICSLRCRASFAPKKEAPNEARAETAAIFQQRALFRENVSAANVVPQAAENLFVPSALCVGSPAKKYAGIEINPPPPAIESIKPARKKRGQTIKSVVLICQCPK